MDILFTGATSLAGREWCRQLLRNGHNVTAVSRTMRSDLPCVQVDLATAGAEASLPDQQFDVLIHFASYVPANEKTSAWEECAPTNIYGLTRLMQWADGRVKRVVLASSCAVYGADKLYTPTDELHRLAPDTQYALTKYAQEQFVHAFCISRGIPFILMRLGYVYGPEMPPERAVVKLLNMVRQGQPITLTNARTAGLHLIHTHDIARIGTHLLQQGFGAYNVVASQHISLLEFVTAAMELTGRQTEVIERNDPQAPITNWYSIAKLRGEGIQPQLSLQEGIATLLSKEASA
jgi:nucleoside-diphosphate-sugar epimerase